MSTTNKKDNSRKRGVAEERRRQRQEEAEERKRAAAKRTPGEQLQVLAARGITSGREVDKLKALIDSGRAHGEVPVNDIVNEDASTYPVTRKQRKQARKGGKA